MSPPWGQFTPTPPSDPPLSIVQCWVGSKLELMEYILLCHVFCCLHLEWGRERGRDGELKGMEVKGWLGGRGVKNGAKNEERRGEEMNAAKRIVCMV